MAKTRRSKTVVELEKRLEALENQGFAQKLLVDELESKIERLEEQLANSSSGIQGIWNPPPVQTQPLSGIKYTTSTGYLGLCEDPFSTIVFANHTYPSAPDANNDYWCDVCGKHLGRGLIAQGPNYQTDSAGNIYFSDVLIK